MKILVAYDKNVSTSRVMDEALLRAKKMGASVCMVRTCAFDEKRFKINQMENQLTEIGDEIFKKNGVL